MVVLHGLTTSLFRKYVHLRTPAFVRLCEDKRYWAPFSSSSYSENVYSPPKPRRFFRKLLFVSILSISAFVGSVCAFETVRNELISYYPPSKQMLKWVEDSVGGWYSDSSRIKQSVVPPVEDFPLPPKQKSKPTPQPKSVPSPEPVIIEKEKPPLPTIEEVKDMTRSRYMSMLNVDLSDLPSLLKELELATVKYIDALRTAVQDHNSVSKHKNWDLVGKLENKLLNKLINNFKNCSMLLNDIKIRKKLWKNNILPESIESHGNLQYKLTGAINEVRKLQNDISMLKRYRDLTSSSHANLQDDLEALLKHLEAKESNKVCTSMNVDELNDLISVAHARIASLQAKLDHLEQTERERMKSALDTQRRGDDAIRQEYIKRELDLERSKHDIERHRWLLEAREAKEHELKLALARHIRIPIREELAKERVAFEAALAGWTKRMEAIEDVVDGRADLDRLAKEAQSLWLACEALACRLHSVSPTMKSDHGNKDDSLLMNHTGSLKDFVDSIRECASSGNYPFVNSILDSLPIDVVHKGVWTEDGLKKRFEKVYNVCRSVTLIDETSGSLMKYALSWLQSVLVLDMKYKYLQLLSLIKRNTTSGSQVQLSEGEDFINQIDSKPDPFCLLSSAKLAITNEHDVPSKDDNTTFDVEGIETAVRLLGQLRGQARVVANDWLVDARHYLEAKQTARTLLAYAAARGISTFQKRL
ncbi:unnamed protein product [Heterobilharzia americana]|nr:unnamed protein product [Heterobilharzia americana]